MPWHACSFSMKSSFEVNCFAFDPKAGPFSSQSIPRSRIRTSFSRPWEPWPCRRPGSRYISRTRTRQKQWERRQGEEWSCHPSACRNGSKRSPIQWIEQRLGLLCQVINRRNQGNDVKKSCATAYIIPTISLMAGTGTGFKWPCQRESRKRERTWIFIRFFAVFLQVNDVIYKRYPDSYKRVFHIFSRARVITGPTGNHCLSEINTIKKSPSKSKLPPFGSLSSPANHLISVGLVYKMTLRIWPGNKKSIVWSVSCGVGFFFARKRARGITSTRVRTK